MLPMNLSKCLEVGKNSRNWQNDPHVKFNDDGQFLLQH